MVASGQDRSLSLFDKKQGFYHITRHHPPVLIIMVTRPKPAYSRQSQAGLWGLDKDQTVTFWGVFNRDGRPAGGMMNK